jgi:hypothetical protein
MGAGVRKGEERQEEQLVEEHQEEQLAEEQMRKEQLAEEQMWKEHQEKKAPADHLDTEVIRLVTNVFH